MTKLNFIDTPSDLDITEDIKSTRALIKNGTISVIPNPCATKGQPVLFVSIEDYAKIKRALSKKEKSGAV